MVGVKGWGGRVKGWGGGGQGVVDSRAGEVKGMVGVKGCGGRVPTPTNSPHYPCTPTTLTSYILPPWMDLY